MSKEDNVQRLVGFFYEAGTLRRIDRSHKQTLLTNDEADNIASHSFRATIISWFLAKAENADPYKAVMMTLLHDIPETRSGDQNWIHKKYVKVFDEEIVGDQTSELPHGDEIHTIMEEYQQRVTIEAKVAKDADLLDQVLLLKEYAWAGNEEAKKWLIGKEQGKRLTTQTAKAWVKEIVNQNPSDWWSNLWTADRR